MSTTLIILNILMYFLIAVSVMCGGILSIVTFILGVETMQDIRTRRFAVYPSGDGIGPSVLLMLLATGTFATEVICFLWLIERV